MAISNAQVSVVIDGDAVVVREHLPDFVVFWDKDIRLALQLERLGLRLFNRAQVIAICDDKSLTHIMLAGQGIAMPRTLVAPLVFPGLDEPDGCFVQRVMDELGFPVVVKECFGSFGAQVYLAHTPTELEALHRRLLHTPHLAQQFIASSAGRDVRLQVVGSQVIAAVRRANSSDFRANASNGGTMTPFNAPSAFVDMALRCCRVLGADFAGVDILFGPDDQPLLCEINSNAHFKNLYHCTGVDAAEAMARHMWAQVRP
jgi:RimK family alpha-L-glutamate ligase